ncbi:MAG: hypothetical protein J6C98_05600 [Oscillospiraceae bacterium]|nr:hypothetical protein [Oscillospiraceae bacterium]
MKNDLIERYIYAVTRRMDHRIRNDVQQELYSLVDDMLAERCGGLAPSEKDIRVVLTELGTPQELYARYSDDGEKCLIGQPYYGTWKLVTKIVLAAVGIGVTVSALLESFAGTQTWYESVLSWLAMLWSGGMQGIGVVTILFAVFSRKGVQLGEPYNLDNLPPVPKKRQQISRGDCIFAIAFCAVITVLLLAAPQYLIGYWGPDKVIALFDTQVLNRCWYLILIFAVADITRSTVRLLEGQYNRKTLIVTLAANAVAAAAAALWLTMPNLINGEFVIHVQEAMAGEEAFIRNIFMNFDRFLLVVILLALILDTVEAAVKTLKK